MAEHRSLVNELGRPRQRLPRRRLVRWSLVGLAALVLLLGACVGTAWVLFRLRGPELIRAELEGALVTALGRPARVGAVTFRPWPVALRVSGVAIASGASWEQGSLLRLDHGDVSVQLESLWRRRLVIGVTLTGIEVTATAAGGGGLAIPIPPDTVAIGPVTARLAVVQIRQGRVLYRDPDASWTVEIRGLDADGWPQPDALTISAAAESLRLESPALRERVERVRAEGTIRAGEVNARRVRFRWEGHEAELSGQLRPTPEGLAVLGTVRGEASLGPIASRAGMTWPLTGIAKFEATLEGPVADPRVDGRITVPELAAAPFHARNVRLEGSFGDGALDLRDIHGDLPGGPVRGAFTLTPDRRAGARRAHLTLDGLRLPGVFASLGPANVQADGRLEGGGIELGPVTARWAAARLGVSGRMEPGGGLGLRADLDADLGPIAHAMGATGVAGPARVTAETTGTWEHPVVAGQADVGPLTLTRRTVDRVELRYRLASSKGFSQWTGSLEAPRVVLPGAPIEGIQAAVVLDAERAEVQRLTGRVHGGPLTLHGSWAWGSEGWAEGDLGPITLDRVRELPAGLSLEGTGQARFRASTQRGTVSATAAIGLRDVSLGGFLFGTGRLDVGVTGRDLTAALEFPAVGLSATSHGRLEEGRTVTAQARLERANLDPMVAWVAPAARGRVLGRVSARAEAEVPLWRPGEIRMTASITPDELVVAGARWTTRSPAIIRWDRGRLSVDQFRAEGPPGTLTASAVMEAGGSDARITVGLEQARLPPPLDRATPGDVRGEARLTRTGLETVSIRGRWPVGTLSLDGRVPFEGPIALRSRLMADGAELARTLGRGRVAGQAIVFADVSGSWREPVASGRIEAAALTSGEVTLTGVTVPFRLTPSTIWIVDARAVLGKDPLALDGKASWTNGGWGGHGTLTAPVLTVSGWPVEALHAAFRVDAERLEATAVSTRIHGVAVRGTGSWQWSGGGRLEARLGPAELAKLRAVPPALDLAGSASGRLDAAIRSLDDVTASLALRFDGVRAAGEALGTGTLAAELRGRAVRAELRFPERRLSATAEGRAETDATMRVRAALDDLPLGELGRRFGLGMVDGSVSARLLAEVPLDHPRALRGTLRLDPLRLVVAGEALTSQEPIVASFDAEALRVERLSLEGRAGTITGRATLHTAGALDAELRGRIPLGVLASLRPEVEGASGILDVGVTARGTTSAPEISGVGALDGASVTVRGYPEPIREIRARLTASPAGLRLVEARGVLGGGTLTASGEAALADGGLGAYRVTLNARRVAATPLDGLSTLWDGDLELAGRAARGLLQGELRLVRGLYTRELAPAAGGPRGSTAGQPSGGVALPLRITVKLDDNLVVRNRTASLRIGGTLSVEGSTAAPAVLGVLETREGRVTFRDRRFTILTATARFVDPRRVDPFLDATATARIREYDVTARVSGRADQLDVRLSSIPPLPQEDLLALVAFGATRAELERSPAGVLAEEAARTIVRDLLGLQSLPGLGGGDGGEQRLQVGTRTSPERTTPAGGPGTESGGQQRVRVEYQLLGPLSLVGERGMSGGYTAGVVLRLRFR